MRALGRLGGLKTIERHDEEWLRRRARRGGKARARKQQRERDAKKTRTERDVLEAALIGRLSRTPELKVSSAGKSYLRLNIAIGTGDATTWCSVAAFEGDLAALAASLEKGDKVYAEGKLAPNTWTTADGLQRSSLSLAAWRVEPLGKIGRRRTKKARAERSTSTAGRGPPCDQAPLGRSDRAQ